MRRLAALTIATGALGLAATHGTPFAAAQAAPTPSPAVTTPAPQSTIPPLTPTPAPAVAPTASATPAYNFVYRPTPAPSTTPLTGPGAPQISEIDLSDATIVAPAAIRVRVLTSDAVTSVTADTFGRTLDIPQERPGVFTLAASIPDVPFFLKNRTYNIEFVAAVPDGRTARVTLPLVLR